MDGSDGWTWILLLACDSRLVDVVALSICFGRRGKGKETGACTIYSRWLFKCPRGHVHCKLTPLNADSLLAFSQTSFIKIRLPTPNQHIVICREPLPTTSRRYRYTAIPCLFANPRTLHDVIPYTQSQLDQIIFCAKKHVNTPGALVRSDLRRRGEQCDHH